MKTRMIFAALVTMVFAVPAFAQDYPARLIKVVVPYPAGGATDAVARPVVHKLGELLDKSVIVENRAGANSILGADYVARSTPDGYTLLINSASQLIIPHYFSSATYDAVKSFTPVVDLAVNRRCIVVDPALPIKNFQEFVDYAKKNPGRLTYGVAAAGSAQEMAGDLLKSETGIDIRPIPYRGGANAVEGVLGGQIAMAIVVLADVVELIRAGKLRPIAIVDGARSKIAPDIPSLSEFGLTMVPDQWVGVFGPAGLPADIQAILNEKINKALDASDTRLALQTLGYEPVGGTVEAFSARMEKDAKIYQSLVEKLRIKPN